MQRRRRTRQPGAGLAEAAMQVQRSDLSATIATSRSLMIRREFCPLRPLRPEAGDLGLR